MGNYGPLGPFWAIIGHLGNFKPMGPFFGGRPVKLTLRITSCTGYPTPKTTSVAGYKYLLHERSSKKNAYKCNVKLIFTLKLVNF